MSTRRPRIKAAANLALAAKRKPKANNLPEVTKKLKEEPSEDNKLIEVLIEQSLPSSNEATQVIVEDTLDKNQNPASESQSVKNLKSEIEAVTSYVIHEFVQAESIAETPNTGESEEQTSTHVIIDHNEATSNNQYSIVDTPPEPQSLESPDVIPHSSTKTLQSFEDAFKYPFNPDYKRSSAAVPTVEENAMSDFEDNILHMDLQKSPGFPMSPTKSRQRIRPTPIFGQRRNSFVGTSPSPHTEDESSGTQRQRSSNSTSSDISGNFLMRKLAAGNLGRIRTESGCSTLSESRGSSRRIPNDDQNKSLKKEYQMRFNGGVPDKSTLKMFDLIYYNPVTNPMESKPPGSNQVVEKPSEEINETEKKSVAMTEAAVPVPQLKLGSNGELMIDEMSLEIETTAETEARKVLANSSLIYHDENTSGQGFYKRSKRTKDWLPSETIKFYRCLQTVGTDFSLMLTLFPNRTRRDLKLKFKKEERCNLNLINKALLYPGTFNIEDLKVQLDAEEKERQEQGRLWKEIKEKQAKKTKKTTNNDTSKASRILASGEETYQNENVTKAKLSKRPSGKNKTEDSATKEPKPKQKRKYNKKPVVDIKKELEVEIDELLAGSEVETMDSFAESEGFNEASINLILNELANGTLALVSSEDLSNPNKTTVNEIYIMCKETNTLSDKPLDLPEDIVDAIKEAITS